MRSIRLGFALLTAVLLTACALDNPSDRVFPDAGPCGTMGAACCPPADAGPGAARTICRGDGLLCSSGNCVACGAAGQPCCAPTAGGMDGGSGGACRGNGVTCLANECVDCSGPDRAVCNGQCVSITSDTNCGGCGTACAAAERCVRTPASGTDGGTMDSGAQGGRVAFCQIQCPPGQSLCGSVCRDLTVDITNCGGCGVSCPTPPVGGTAVCVGGMCRLSMLMCPSDRRDCDAMSGNGCETTILTDTANCGGCGTRCSNMGGTPGCTGGLCTIACATDRGNCNADASDGCETNFQNEVRNCGGCNRVCALPNVMANSCVAGACAVAAGSCATGFADCDGVAANGCEVNTQVDSTRCGSCSNACASGQVCSGGVCGLTCASPFVLCPMVGSTPAYCANTSLDPSNCGAGMAGCGNVCNLANTNTHSCGGGACVPVTCDMNFGNCDGLAPNGCEANLQTDNAHCGGCGRVCSGGQTCTAGVCQCPPGRTFCNGSCTATLTDVNNCGPAGASSCGRGCALANVATNSCVAGACVVASAASCAPGYANCDGMAANGCEVNTQVDSTRCGSCGNACASGQVCSAGVCGTTCASPLTTCGPSGATFCANTSIDPSNCGAGMAGCGNVCNLANTNTHSCGGGACVPVTCDMNFGNCDGLAPNGCEANLQTSNTHCGACGRACTGGQTCSAGACQCPAGQTFCNGSCTNTTTDVNNCGPAGASSCGRVCALANVATNSCVSGACVVASAASCSPGYANCDGMAANGCEVDTRVDSTRCGSCSNACASGQVCSAGVCGTTCGGGLTTCGTAPATYCANTNTDPSNCGAAAAGCGRVCALANTSNNGCTSGNCVPVACTSGFGNCNGTASDGCEAPLNTITNCGICGRACSGGQACVAGACQCPAGQTLCGGVCTNTLTDRSNCGGCGTVCALANVATNTCVAGACVVASAASCSTGYANCDNAPANGCEVDTRVDSTRCGSCTNACASGQVCSAGVCGTTCASPLTTCGPSGATYCANTSIDPANCGAGAAGCGNVCSLANTATRGCSAGVCVPVACTSGFGNCNSMASDGCEAPLNTTTNCGSCGRACATGQTCTAGSCVCPAGQTLCGGACTNTLIDRNNCGGCGTVCALANVATNTCVAGACVVASPASCSPGYANCDNAPANGCEVDTRVDSTRCGSCTNACASGQVCSASVCGTTCGGGLTTCGTAPATFCANTSIDPANCGACGTTCNLANTTTNGCASGGCVPVGCSANFGNCDGMALNGCEANFNSNVDHCGSCAPCPARSNATRTCASGVCGFSCSTGFGDCVNILGPDGCETPLNTTTNCGACGNACVLTNASAAACTAGACVFTCSTGFDDCDGLANNGCEADLTSAASCGECGVVCSGGTPNCVAGVCAP